jgi:hypothetical protein
MFKSNETYSFIEEIPMKKYILLIVLIAVAFLVYPSVGLASYKITLRNGSILYAGHYWKEGGQVLFYTSGGILGVGEDSVSKIEESDVAVRVAAPPAAKPADDLAKVEEAIPKAKEGVPDETPPDEKGAVNNKLMDEFNALKGRYDVAGSLTTDELFALSKDMTAFRDRVLQSRLGFVYSDQLVELYSMGDEVEAIIKSRGQ